ADPQWAQAEGFALLADAFLAEASAADDNGAGNRSIVFKQALTKIDLNEAARDYLVELRASSDDKALRWKALAALVANGAIDDVEALVAQELEADNTASGYQASLRALAAFNSDENKRAVWDEIMSLQLSNLELRHKLEGLTMSGSEKHLIFAPDEYFANAQKVWDAGSSEIALGTIQGLYPSWNVSQETIDATDKFLENELPSGLRRAVTEERDRLARALRNRAIDAQ
ncbi:MAG: ERAP1-like C-terminal domain-containing protein, partial [Corynebacterium casei]